MQAVDALASAIVRLAAEPGSLGERFHFRAPRPVAIGELVDVLNTLGYQVERVPTREWYERCRQSAGDALSATEAEMLDPNLAPPRLLYRLFHQEQPRVFEPRPFLARCRCSRDRIDRVLRSIKREELDDLRDASGRVAVKCEFCSTEYPYDDDDLDRLYTASA